MKKIPGFDGYEITSDGKLYCVDKRKYRKIPKPNKLGYSRYTITDGQGKSHHVGVHSLILMAFVGPRPKGFHAAHLDGNPRNNTLKNLKWASPKENSSHRILHGTLPFGSKVKAAKISEKDVMWLRKNYKFIKNKSNIGLLAKKLKINVQNAREIVHGYHWKQVDCMPVPARRQLSKDDVLYIRNNYTKYQNGKTNVGLLAEKFNVSKCTVFYIMSNRIWKNVVPIE
jgi:HNH endonuclease